MESLLKTYVNNCKKIPPNQLIQLNDNLINSSIRVMSSEEKFWLMAEIITNRLQDVSHYTMDKYKKLYDKLAVITYKEHLKTIDEVISTLNDLSTEPDKNNFLIAGWTTVLANTIYRLNFYIPGKLNEITQKIANSEFFYKIKDMQRRDIIKKILFEGFINKLDLNSFERHPDIISFYIIKANDIDKLYKILTISDEYFNKHRNQLDDAFYQFTFILRHNYIFTDNLFYKKKLIELYRFFKKWNLDVEGKYSWVEKLEGLP